MSKHTPGPWHWGKDWESLDSMETDDEGCWPEKYMDLGLYGPEDALLGLRIDHYNEQWDTVHPSRDLPKADRDLIAAAPDLLRVCQLVALGSLGSHTETLLELAIAKATGTDAP